MSKLGKLRPHWLKITWAFLVFNAIMLLWVVTGLTAQSSGGCQNLDQQTCAAASDVGHGIAFALQVFVWVAGVIILGIAWLMVHARVSRKEQNASLAAQNELLLQRVNALDNIGQA